MANLSTDARELHLYTTNHGDIYRQQHGPVQRNLQKKLDKGTYDSEKAVKAFRYTADLGSKYYAKEHGNGSGHAFSTKVRDEVAHQLRDDFESETKAGNRYESAASMIGAVNTRYSGDRDRDPEGHRHDNEGPIPGSPGEAAVKAKQDRRNKFLRAMGHMLESLKEDTTISSVGAASKPMPMGPKKKKIEEVGPSKEKNQKKESRDLRSKLDDILGVRTTVNYSGDGRLLFIEANGVSQESVVAAVGQLYPQYKLRSAGPVFGSSWSYTFELAVPYVTSGWVNPAWPTESFNIDWIGNPQYKEIFEAWLNEFEVSPEVQSFCFEPKSAVPLDSNNLPDYE